MLRPRVKLALRWPGAGHPVKRVRQKGIKPHDFLRLAMQQSRAEMRVRLLMKSLIRNQAALANAGGGDSPSNVGEARAVPVAMNQSALANAATGDSPSNDSGTMGIADPGGGQTIHPYPGETSFYPSEQNCGHYPRQGLSNIAYGICLHAGDNAWANAVRAGLKIDYLEKGYSSDWFLIDHPKWFILSSGYIIEQTIMGNMLEIEKYIADTFQVKSDD